ncbi:MAG: amino acid adenylation domain-containing protein [Clostridium sp.]|jgi:amino acid adenylation domain-containing protein|nr:amino acid adenylation domain-containing protein [Clostridium sp.]
MKAHQRKEHEWKTMNPENGNLKERMKRKADGLAAGKDLYPLTQAQSRVWYTQVLNEGKALFHIGGLALIHGEIDPEKLLEAFELYRRQNDAFSIRILLRDGVPMQYFDEGHPSAARLLDIHDQTSPEEYLHRWAEETMKAPFPMEAATLYEFTVFRIHPGLCAYVIKLHHIIGDGWSMQLLAQGLSKFYELLIGQEEPGVEPVSSYREAIASEQRYLQSGRYEKDKRFWNAVYSKEAEFSFKPDRDIEGKRKAFFLGKAMSGQIKEFCRQHSLSENAFFTGVFVLLESKLSGKEDIILDLPFVGRGGRRERTIFGMFVSTLLARFEVDADRSLGGFLKDVHRRIHEYFLHSRYPYRHLVSNQGIEAASISLASVNYYGTVLRGRMARHAVEYHEIFNGCQEYALQLVIRKWSEEDGFEIDFDYKISSFSESRAAGMFQMMKVLMDKILHTSDRKIRDISLLKQEEEERLFYEGKLPGKFSVSEQSEGGRQAEQQMRGSCPARSEKTSGDCENLVDMFDTQAEETPERIAVQCGEELLSYQELRKRAEGIAAFLEEKGVRPDELTAVIMRHSLMSAAVIMGILKSGGAFLPIDPSWPGERIEFILKDAAVRIVLHDHPAPTVRNEGVCLYDFRELQGYEAAGFTRRKIAAETLAYCIYTSGSTGKPKGVMIEHRNIANYISWAKDTYVTEEREVFPLYSSFAFDLTMTSIFTPLVSGGKILVYEGEESEYVLYRIVRENLCTVVKLTPAHLKLLRAMETQHSDIRKFIVGGDDLKTALAKEIHRLFQGRAAIYNEYGPTEASVGCMIHQFDPEKEIGESVPIGKPIRNTRIFILDKDDHPVPPDVTGNLYIEGAGLARGYLNRKELTEHSFLIHPITRQRMYRTGDRARFLDDGTIVYEGREDSQKKIRGYRIEISEIENVLLAYPGIEDAAVHVRETEKGGSMLCAYFVAGGSMDTGTVRQYLLRKLPGYMVPSVILQIDGLPLTVNGKVDPSLLPLPGESHGGGQNMDFLDGWEKLFFGVVSDVLETGNVRKADDFYHLGGDSIKAIQIAARLKNEGYQIKIHEILEHPVFSDMLSYVLPLVPKKEDESALCEGVIPLSPIMRWFFEQKLQKPGRYCQSVQIRFDHRAERETLRQILYKLVLHHDMLRVNVGIERGEVFYRNDVRIDDVVVTERDFEALSEAAAQKAIKEKNEELLDQIDLYADRLLLGSCLYHTGSGDLWNLTVHHLAVDGVSWRILLEDVETLYEQSRNGQELSLPRKTDSYRRWAGQFPRGQVELRKGVPPKDPQESLGEAPPQSQAVRSDVPLSRGSVSSEISELLMTTANRPYRTRPVELIAAAMVLAAEACLGRTMNIEIETHGRDGNLDLTRTVGWFTNILPLEISESHGLLPAVIKDVKDAYRRLTKEGMDRGSFRTAGDHTLRINFLGAVRSQYQHFCCEPVLDHGIEMTAGMEANLLLAGKELKVVVRAKGEVFSFLETQRFVRAFQKAVEDIVRHCLQEKETTFTVSDFEHVKLSQSDLELLLQ